MPEIQSAPDLEDNHKENKSSASVNGDGPSVGRNADADVDADADAINANANTLLERCDEIAAKVNAFLEEDLDDEVLKAVQERTRIALGVISETLDRYSLEEVSFSYNGGKDCLVLLILLLAGLSIHHSLPANMQNKNKTLPNKFPSVYIISPHPFAEVDEFVNTSSEDYHLSLSRYAMPMKQAFAKYLEENKHVKAILVGTRRTDPHGGLLTHFDMTDGGWPRFMRVHPVIDWHYREIWAFIRHLKIPYCPLYDQGYTSLGGTTDTHPNPVLVADTKGQKFRPAYELVEDQEERLGRDS